VIHPFVSLVELRTSRVEVEIMFIHPLLVPAMIYAPFAVKTVAVVSCLLSCAASFSSISPSEAESDAGR